MRILNFTHYFAYLLILPIIFFSISCNESGTSSKTYTDSSTSAKQVDTGESKMAVIDTTKHPKNLVSKEIKSPKGNTFITLEFPHKEFFYYMGLKRFVEFRIIPYQRSSENTVRLYVMALSAHDITDPKYVIGAFSIPSDGNGEDPRTLSNVSEELGLVTYGDLNSWGIPTDGRIFLVPETGLVKTNPPVMPYITFRIAIDNIDSDQTLNPSPPFQINFLKGHD